MADTYTIKTEYGSIDISKSVVAKVAAEVIDETNGVKLASIKYVMPRTAQNIEVSFDKDGKADIKCYVIVRFGTSISNATYSIINEIKNRVTVLTGVIPASVSVNVVGTLSKTLTRRNINVSRRYTGKEK